MAEKPSLKMIYLMWTFKSTKRKTEIARVTVYPDMYFTVNN